MRVSIRLWLMLATLVLCSGAAADSYPDRAIHMIVPFPPGGPASVVADVVGPQLGERLEQRVIVENRAGADGIIGSEFVAKAPPDGYTLLLATSAQVIHPGTYISLPFDTETAFAPVSLLLTSQYLLVVNPSLPVDSVEELIAYAKTHPGKLVYASGGLGGPTHLAFELFKITAGINLANVSYEGDAGTHPCGDTDGRGRASPRARGERPASCSRCPTTANDRRNPPRFFGRIMVRRSGPRGYACGSDQAPQHRA